MTSDIKVVFNKFKNLTERTTNYQWTPVVENHFFTGRPMRYG